MTTTQRKGAVGSVAVVIVVVAVVLGHLILQPPAPGSIVLIPQPSAPSSGAPKLTGKVCPVVAGASTATIQAAVNLCTNGGTVELAAGTYPLTDHVVVRTSEVITGAGPTLTFLVQHARRNIFEIDAPGVTVESMNLNTATYNPGVPPIRKDPVPSVLFSAQSHTSIIDITAEAGTGFGMRITGPNPCDSYRTTGTIVSNVNVTNTGTGGFTALDVDCTNGATITNVVIHGDYLALYQDENVDVNGLTVTPGPYEQQCGAPVYVTGPSNHIRLDNVLSHGGGIITHGTKNGQVTTLTEVHDTVAPGAPC
ncbi:MAG TPA: hypothetical protein VND88_00860 [Candidatus Acidoferrales bacterium]|nr:hypothetical protein [Candidatus Acidoferrales bacterium]